MTRTAFALFTFLCGINSATVAEEAHVHGAAKLQIAAEGEHLEVVLVSPLENLVGFEHAPRNDKERKAVKSMIDAFNKPGTLLTPTAAAKCSAEPAEITSPVTGHGTGKPAENDAHAELEAVIVYQCANPSALKGMEVRLFHAFPQLKRIRADIVSDRGQRSATLTAQRRSLSW
jgi:hypothetical protein